MDQLGKSRVSRVTFTVKKSPHKRIVNERTVVHRVTYRNILQLRFHSKNVNTKINVFGVN